MTEDLVAWLLEQVDAEDRNARAALDQHGDRDWSDVDLALGLYDGGISPEGDPIAWHISRWDPRRAQAECNTKRRMMERPGPFCSCSEFDQPMDPDTNWTVPIAHHYDCSAYEAAKVFAEVYADRPGYRSEWKP